MITNDIVAEKARAAGFSLVGFASAEKLTEETGHLNEWLSRGYQAGMKYMERNNDKREDIDLVLPGAKTVISLALNYYTEGEYSGTPEKGKISRYAWGKDYHLIMWDLLDKLINELKEIDSSFKGLSYVDTGPVMDKAWALKAGLGWMGKHSNIINREIGSWFFIGSIVTNYEFQTSELVPDHCGSCTACIDACPTNAIIADYIVDANRCISYLTIENKEETIPEQFKGNFKQWIFGCDICQDVCPWNIRFAMLSDIKEFSPINAEIKISEAENMSEDEFKEKFSVSPVKRAKLNGLKRNVRFIKP